MHITHTNGMYTNILDVYKAINIDTLIYTGYGEIKLYQNVYDTTASVGIRRLIFINDSSDLENNQLNIQGRVNYPYQSSIDYYGSLFHVESLQVYNSNTLIFNAAYYYSFNLKILKVYNFDPNYISTVTLNNLYNASKLTTFEHKNAKLRVFGTSTEYRGLELNKCSSISSFNLPDDESLLVPGFYILSNKYFDIHIPSTYTKGALHALAIFLANSPLIRNIYVDGNNSYYYTNSSRNKLYFHSGNDGDKIYVVGFAKSSISAIILDDNINTTEYILYSSPSFGNVTGRLFSNLNISRLVVTVALDSCDPYDINKTCFANISYNGSINKFVPSGSTKYQYYFTNSYGLTWNYKIDTISFTCSNLDVIALFMMDLRNVTTLSFNVNTSDKFKSYHSNYNSSDNVFGINKSRLQYWSHIQYINADDELPFDWKNSFHLNEYFRGLQDINFSSDESTQLYKQIPYMLSEVNGTERSIYSIFPSDKPDLTSYLRHIDLIDKQNTIRLIDYSCSNMNLNTILNLYDNPIPDDGYDGVFSYSWNTIVSTYPNDVYLTTSKLFFEFHGDYINPNNKYVCIDIAYNSDIICTSDFEYVKCKLTYWGNFDYNSDRYYIYRIYSSVFDDCEYLKEVQLKLPSQTSDDIYDISTAPFKFGIKVDYNAFHACYDLESIDFAPYIVSLGAYAFEDCPAPLNVCIGKNINFYNPPRNDSIIITDTSSFEQYCLSYANIQNLYVYNLDDDEDDDDYIYTDCNIFEYNTIQNMYLTNTSTRIPEGMFYDVTIVNLYIGKDVDWVDFDYLTDDLELDIRNVFIESGNTTYHASSSDGKSPIYDYNTGALLFTPSGS